MRTQLLDLPAELIIAITSHQNISDILSLRRTCKTLAETCDFPLRDRKSRLYLHPRSVEYAITLLHDNKWTEGITEVIILGSCEPEMKTRDSMHVTEWRLDFHPWDQVPPGSDVSVTDGFQTNYAALLQGLARLQKLKVLKYAGGMEGLGLGFCGVRDETIWQHAKVRDNWRSSFGGEEQPKLRQALRTIWWSDAEVFMGLLSFLGENFKRIEVLQPMPAVKELTEDFVTRRDAATEVQITGPGQRGWEAFLEHTFGRLRNIEVLEVEIRTEIDEDIMRWKRNLPSAREAILWEEETAGRRFDFEEVADGSHLKRLVVRAATQYPYSLRDTDIVSILEKHRDSLLVVEFHNIIPISVDMEGLLGAGISPVYSMEKGIRETLDFMRTSMKLEKTKMTVPRLGCVEGCGGEEHDAACGVYPILDDFAEVEELDCLAEKRNIELKGNLWDFAMNVYGQQPSLIGTAALKV